MNTLVDFTRGVDTASSSDLTLVSGDLTPSQVAKLIAGCYGLAAAAAAPLCAMSRAPLPLLLSLLATGAGSAFVYTGGPGLKYRALGDLLISTTFGPLLVAFTYIAQVCADHTPPEQARTRVYPTFPTCTPTTRACTRHAASSGAAPPTVCACCCVRSRGRSAPSDGAQCSQRSQ